MLLVKRNTKGGEKNEKNSTEGYGFVMSVCNAVVSISTRSGKRNGNRVREEQSKNISRRCL